MLKFFLIDDKYCCKKVKKRPQAKLLRYIITPSLLCYNNGVIYEFKLLLLIIRALFVKVV